MATKAIGYVRVSTEEQAKSGLGRDHQVRKIREYAQLYELDLVDIVIDDGASAKNLNRDGVQEVIEAAKQQDIDSIIIYKLDRLTRSVRDLNILIELFNKHDVALCSVQDNLDTKSASGRMVINILGTISQWERETIGERTAEALAELKAQGKRYGNVPFGKRLVDDQLVDCPEEAEIIDTVAKLKRKGYSLNKIAASLNRRGYSTRRGTKFNKNNVRNLVALVA